jgi:diguanylate cyclase (GGDEF)-like protein
MFSLSFFYKIQILVIAVALTATPAIAAVHEKLSEQLLYLTDFRTHTDPIPSLEQQLEISNEVAIEARKSGYLDLVYQANSVYVVRAVDKRQFDEVERRFKESESYIGKSRYPVAKMRFLIAMMKSAFYQGDKDLAYKYLTLAEKQLENGNISDFEKIGILYFLGDMQYQLGDYRNGLLNIRRVQELADEVEMTDERRNTLKLSISIVAGNVHFDIGDYDRALKYYTKGLKSAEALNVFSMTASYQFNVALVYFTIEDWENTYRAAIKSADLLDVKGDVSSQAVSLELAAKAEVERGKFEQAITLQRGAIELHQSIGDDSFEINAWAAMAYIYSKSGKVEEARFALKKIEDFTENAKEILADNQSFLRARYNVNKKLMNLEDAIVDIERLMSLEKAEATMLDELEAKRLTVEYEVDVMTARAEVLERENALKTLQLEKKKDEEFIQRMIMGLVLLASIFVVFLLVRERSNKNKMHKLAMTDPLTGAPNRRAIESIANDMLNERDKKPVPVAVALIDLDHFKRINDTHGHDGGDEVLKMFVNTCKPLLRKGDLLGRFGGEEFLLLLPNATEVDVNMIFERLQSALRDRTVMVNGEELKLTITMSMGVSFETENGMASKSNIKERFEHLVKEADDNVYRAKENGRDQMILPA